MRIGGAINRIGRVRAPWLSTVLSVVMPLLIIGSAVIPQQTAYADSAGASETSVYEQWLRLEDQNVEVTEGDDFSLEILRGEESTNPSSTLKVYWYTAPITADQSDFDSLNREEQVSDADQTEAGTMARTFQTKEDKYSELDETFKVRFENAREDGEGGERIVTIKDDERVGIYDLEVISQPSGGSENDTYVPGDVIEIAAYFTGPVTRVNPDTGNSADDTGIMIRVGDGLRHAGMRRGDGTDTIVFGYTVQRGDEDRNGISIVNGNNKSDVNGLYFSQGNAGLWASDSDETEKVNRWYHGMNNIPGTLVDGDDSGCNMMSDTNVDSAQSQPKC